MPDLLPKDNVVVIFDGVCTLCNGAVDFLMRNDMFGRLRFGAFQSEKGAALLRAQGVHTAPETIYVLDGGTLHAESDAILRVARYLRWPWNWLPLFRIVPRAVRNALYRWVARNRYRWFGQKDTCRIPTPEEKAKFL